MALIEPRSYVSNFARLGDAPWTLRAMTGHKPLFVPRLYALRPWGLSEAQDAPWPIDSIQTRLLLSLRSIPLYVYFAEFEGTSNGYS
jgi:hypothetical protein